MRRQETEIETQLFPLLMNQIRSASESVDIFNLGLAPQWQTSKFELSPTQTEVSRLRISLGRNSSSKIQVRKSCHGSRQSFVNLAEIARPLSNLGTAEVETARVQS